MMAIYESIPKEVEAFQYTGLPSENHKLIAWFTTLGEDATKQGQLRISSGNPQVVTLETPSFEAVIEPTDWIIRNENGVIFMADNEAFEANYVFSEGMSDPSGGSNEKPLVH